jgi:hypothetical protein
VTDRIEISDIEPLTSHNEGLIEAGKAMLVSSVDVGRDFCKSMITVATAAIPVYIALVGLAVGKDFRPDFQEGLVLSLAPAALLASAISFGIGYFPKSASFSLDVPSEIDAVRQATLKKRMRWAYIGLGLFVLGVVLSMASVYYGLSLDVTTTTPTD